MVLLVVCKVEKPVFFTCVISDYLTFPALFASSVLEIVHPMSLRLCCLVLWAGNQGYMTTLSRQLRST